MRHFTRTLQGAALAALALLCACLDQTSFIQPQPPGSSGDTTTGTVQRATLLVTVPVAPADSALAARIGSTAGRLAAAAVTIERTGSAASRQSDTTDATGTVEFTGLLPGTWRVSVIRVLTAAETARFDSVDADVNAFGGSLVVDVRPPETRAAAEALAGRRGSLVISEVFGGVGESGGLFTYHFGGYVALYNNSDTTIYLDGKIFGLGPPYGRDARTAINAMTCDDGASWQLDPEGLWSRFFWRIPGGGSEHPLPPGRSVVLATDAIDHRAVDSRLPDLSAADFEFIGPTDADNPTVPNLVSLGYYGDPSVQGHGLLIGYTSTVIYFVADSLNPASLPTARLPYVPELVPRVPRAKILDVFTSFLGPDWEIQAPLPACPRLVSSVFDQQAGSLLGFPRTDTTIIRKAIGQLPDGRWLLQRTKATAVDFALRKRGDAGQVP